MSCSFAVTDFELALEIQVTASTAAMSVLGCPHHPHGTFCPCAAQYPIDTPGCQHQDRKSQRLHRQRQGGGAEDQACERAAQSRCRWGALGSMRKPRTPSTAAPVRSSAFNNALSKPAWRRRLESKKRAHPPRERILDGEGAAGARRLLGAARTAGTLDPRAVGRQPCRVAGYREWKG